MTIVAGSVAAISCNDQNTKSEKTASTDSTATKIKEDSISYNLKGVNYKGFVVYDASKKDKRPAVLVVHEWWGLNDYSRMRAKQLAELGYIAMAVDMYGDGKTAADPQAAQALSSPFYNDPQMAKERFDAAYNKLKEYPETDPSNMAAIGYCFGGSIVLNVAKMGADLKGVVSFHGILQGVPPDKNLTKAQFLICHGAADKFVPKEQVDAFKHSMDSAGVKYTFKAYPDALHAFTNPASTENGKKFNIPIAYNEAADKASWNDMKDFFNKLFSK